MELVIGLLEYSRGFIETQQDLFGILVFMAHEDSFFFLPREEPKNFDLGSMSCCGSTDED